MNKTMFAVFKLFDKVNVRSTGSNSYPSEIIHLYLEQNRVSIDLRGNLYRVTQRVTRQDPELITNELVAC